MPDYIPQVRFPEQLAENTIKLQADKPNIGVALMNALGQAGGSYFTAKNKSKQAAIDKQNYIEDEQRKALDARRTQLVEGAKYGYLKPKMVDSGNKDKTGNPVMVQHPDFEKKLLTNPEEVLELNPDRYNKNKGLTEYQTIQHKMYVDKRFSAFEKAIDPAGSPGRNALGIATRNRLISGHLQILMNMGKVTPERLSIANTEIMSLAGGGVPPASELERTEYSNIINSWTRLKEKVMSKPEGVDTTEIVDEYKNIAKSIQSVDDAMIDGHTKAVADAWCDLAAEDEDRYFKIINDVSPKNLFGTPGMGGQPSTQQEQQQQPQSSQKSVLTGKQKTFNAPEKKTTDPNLIKSAFGD